MKKISFSGFIMCIFTPLVLFAQDYRETKAFVEKGYTYQCDVNKGTSEVILFNKENKYTYAKQYYTDTQKKVSLDDAYLNPFEDDNWTKSTSYSIINNAFSTEQKTRVKGHKISVEMFVDSQTGKVVEVCFGFLYISPFATIPLSVYRHIELELKEKIWFVPNAKGKRLNYIYIGWIHKVE